MALGDQDRCWCLNASSRFGGHNFTPIISERADLICAFIAFARHQMQRLVRDGRRYPAKLKRFERIVTKLARGQLQQQRGGERSMHHQPAITLDIASIGRIVVNAVRVEGQR